MAAVMMLGRNVGVSSGVGVSSPRIQSDCRRARVSLRRNGVAALPCRVAELSRGRCVLRAAPRELPVDDAQASRIDLQVHEVETQNFGDEAQTALTLSRFESLLEEKSAQVAQEVALRTQDGIVIYLVGMMASGKSIVGREVAKALKFNFCDRCNDDVIESFEGGKPCGEIYVLLGETTPRLSTLYTRALQEQSKEKCLVMATGGGAVCKEDNWKYLNGVMVWLDVPTEELVKRVTKDGADSRPVLGGKCPKAEIPRLMQERRPHYAKAHCRISLQDLAESLELTDVGAVTPTAIAVQVLEEVKQALQKEKYIPPPTGH